MRVAISALLFFALHCSLAIADVAGGIAAYRRGDYATAYAEFSSAAGRDDPFSQNVLGTMYAQGQGVERDYKLAMDWFYKAQALGLPEAMTNLARLYELGLGVPKNNAAALQFYRDAARLGFQPAVLRMVEIYAKGELGVAPDLKAALGWRDRLHRQPTEASPAASARPAAPLQNSARTAAGTAARSPQPVQSRVKHDTLFEQRLLQRLNDYRQNERKLYVASTDTTPSLAAYLKALRSRLQGQLATIFSAPRPAASLIVTLAIRSNGAVTDIELSRGSGNPKNDRNVVAALKQLTQLQPLPAEIGGSVDVLMVSVGLPIE